MPVCPEYTDDRTCLECPYPDGAQPCFVKKYLNVEITAQDLEFLQTLQKASGLKKKEVVGRMFEFCRKHLNPAIKE